MQALVAFVVGCRVQHTVVHQLLVVAVQHFPDQEEVFLKAVAMAAQPPHEVMV